MQTSQAASLLHVQSRRRLSRAGRSYADFNSLRPSALHSPEHDPKPRPTSNTHTHKKRTKKKRKKKEEGREYKKKKKEKEAPIIVQELCESRGGRPGLSVLTSLLVSVDVKIY